jgi:nitrogen regulatory protein PII
MASTSGTRWTGSAQVAYAAAKAGVIQMSKVMAIQHAAETGAIGDGKIFEFDLAGALRIRTGDTNETAL